MPAYACRTENTSLVPLVVIYVKFKSTMLTIDSPLEKWYSKQPAARVETEYGYKPSRASSSQTLTFSATGSL